MEVPNTLAALYFGRPLHPTAPRCTYFGGGRNMRQKWEGEGKGESGRGMRPPPL